MNKRTRDALIITFFGIIAIIFLISLFLEWLKEHPVIFTIFEVVFWIIIVVGILWGIIWLWNRYLSDIWYNDILPFWRSYILPIWYWIKDKFKKSG